MIGGIDAPMNGATKLEFENWIKLATDNVSKDGIFLLLLQIIFTNYISKENQRV